MPCVIAAGVPSVLKKAELPIVRNEICESSFKTTRLGSFFRLHSSFICAGGEDGVNACRVSRLRGFKTLLFSTGWICSNCAIGLFILLHTRYRQHQASNGMGAFSTPETGRSFAITVNIFPFPRSTSECTEPTFPRQLLALLVRPPVVVVPGWRRRSPGLPGGRLFRPGRHHLLVSRVWPAGRSPGGVRQYHVSAQLHPAQHRSRRCSAHYRQRHPQSQPARQERHLRPIGGRAVAVPVMERGRAASRAPRWRCAGIRARMHSDLKRPDMWPILITGKPLNLYQWFWYQSNPYRQDILWWKIIWPEGIGLGARSGRSMKPN